MAFNEMLQLIITANGSQAIGEMNKVGTTATTQLGGAQKSAGGLAAGFKKNAGAIAVGAVAIGAAIKVSVDAFEEQRAATLKLENSLKNNPRIVDKSTQAFLAQASALQLVTVVSDEQIISAQAMLATFRVTSDQLTALTPLVVDYAQRYGIDLVSAAKAVGKAMQGNIGALQKQGVILDANAYASDRFGTVMKGLRENAGGFAREEAKTLTGQLAIMRNMAGEVAEKFGAAIVPALLTVIGVARQVGGTLDDILGPIGGLGKAVESYYKIIISPAAAAANALDSVFASGDKMFKQSGLTPFAGEWVPRVTMASNVAKKLADAQDDLAGKTKASALAFEEQQTKILAAKDAITAFFGGQINLSQAQTAVTEKLEAYNAALADGSATATDRQNAEDALKESFLSVSSAIQSNADANMDGVVSADEQKAATDRQIYSLAGMANSLAPGSPVRAFLDQYIMQLRAASGDFIARMILQTPSNFRQGAYGPELNIGFGWRPVAIGPGGQLQMRATGGPVVGGNPYMVGEQGPELFVPNTSGAIVPNHDLARVGAAGASGGGGSRAGASVVVNITAPVGADRAAIGREIQELLDAYGLRRGSLN